MRIGGRRGRALINLLIYLQTHAVLARAPFHPSYGVRAVGGQRPRAVQLREAALLRSANTQTIPSTSIGTDPLVEVIEEESARTT